MIQQDEVKQKSYKCANRLITWLTGIPRPAGSCNLVTLKTNFAQYKKFVWRVLFFSEINRPAYMFIRHVRVFMMIITASTVYQICCISLQIGKKYALNLRQMFCHLSKRS